MRNFGLASLLAVCLLPVTARSDDKLVLDLPPSSSAIDAIKSVQSDQAVASDLPPASRFPQAPNTSAVPNRHGSPRTSAGEKVIGRLGVSARASKIYAGHGKKSRLLAKVPAGAYLALTGAAGDWYGVLMADRTTAWIPSRDVNVLSYEVVAPNRPQLPRYTQIASRGGIQVLGSGQRALLNEAYRYLGVPYRFGGTTAAGLDCSAFVQHCFSSLGIGLPRTAAEQMACGVPITDQLEPGDRVYFANKSGRISHTGIYLGDGYFIHASSSNHAVSVSRLTDSMYSRMYAGARR